MFRALNFQLFGLKNYLPIPRRFLVNFFFFWFYRAAAKPLQLDWFLRLPGDSSSNFPYCFSRAAAIPLFALEPFGKFWRFLFWFLLKNLSFNITHRLGPLFPTIRPNDLYSLHMHTKHDGGCALTDRPVAVVPTIRRHAVYPLHIHSSHDERFCTHSRASTRSANNTATCPISIAHSH